ncbi:MAG: hypothetical protein CMP23_11875 [Rickettsiales bacterium]|nr:hypothetical protein [Rickettsiales bacterium]
MDKVFEELSLKLRARYPFVYFLTWEEERALRGLKKLARQQKRPLWEWSMVAGLRRGRKAVDGSDSAEAALRHLAAEKDPFFVILKDFHQHIHRPEVARQLRDMSGAMAERSQTLLFLSPFAQIPSELEKDIATLELPLPGLKEVARLFHTLIKGENIEVDLDLFEQVVKASLGLTEDEIKRVYGKVLLRSGSFSREQLVEIISEKSQIIRRSEFLEFHPLNTSMEEVGGLENLKEWLNSRAGSFSEKARSYGLPQPRGIFLLGVQGCGKSLTAKAIADLWKVPLLRLDVGALVLGASAAEEGLRRAIRIAESMAPVVLWVDEIEKAFAGVDSGAGDSAGAARIFGSFITWLQEKEAPVFVVATGNDVRRLPPELLRKGRFDEIFWVDLPDIHERETIFKIHLRRRGREPANFDCWELAEVSDRFSGAEIEQSIIDAMFSAFAEDREVATLDVLRAIRQTVPLARTMDQAIKELKEWAHDRTRPATWDSRRVDYFKLWENSELESG